jgi:hypothetical protein
MNDPQLDKLLSGIEAKSKDDFAMLEECGAEYFSTTDLLEMRGRWKEQTRIFTKLHKANIILGASAPAWLVLAAICGISGFEKTATSAIFMFPIVLLIFILGAFFLHSQFQGKTYLEFIGREIEYELGRRKADVKQKRNL